MPTDTLCRIPHPKPTHTIDDLLVCHRHHEQIPRWLDDILTTYALLDHTPGNTQDTTNHRGKQIDPTAPLRLDVAALTDPRTYLPPSPRTWTDASGKEHIEPDIAPVLASLHAWATLVRTERQLTTPTHEPTLLSETRTLITHNTWICAQEFITDYHHELHQARTQVRHLTGEPAPVSVGRCPLTYDDGPCKGRLYQDRWAYLAVICNKCHTRWEEDDLRRLGLVLGA